MAFIMYTQRKHTQTAQRLGPYLWQFYIFIYECINYIYAYAIDADNIYLKL